MDTRDGRFRVDGGIGARIDFWELKAKLDGRRQAQVQLSGAQKQILDRKPVNVRKVDRDRIPEVDPNPRV